jgi:penicillin-binding protein 2
MMVALAALESGAVTPATRVSCPGYLELGDTRFHCWKRGGHGAVDMLEGIAQSCDVYFYEVARRTGPDKIADMSRRFGLGASLALDLPGERPGLIPTRDWKLRTYGQPWTQGDTLVMGIGQGYVLATPLQLAVMTARLANGGIAITPHLTRDRIIERRAESRAAGAVPRIAVSQAHLQVVLRGMDGVVNGERGTARRVRLPQPGVAMAGKTGTSQVRRITRQERAAGLPRPEEVDWRYRDHALFVCFAPVDRPRLAVSVIVEHGGGGSAVAAPIAQEIVIEALRRAPQQLVLSEAGDCSRAARIVRGS